MCQGSGFLFVFYWPHWQLQYMSWGVVGQFMVSIIVNIVSGKRLNYLFPIRSIKLLISRDIIGNNAPSSFKAWARSLWRVSLDRWDPFWRTCGENNAMWWNIQVLCWVKIKTNYSMWDEVTRLTRDTCHEFFSLVFFLFSLSLFCLRCTCETCHECFCPENWTLSTCNQRSPCQYFTQ